MRPTTQVLAGLGALVLSGAAAADLLGFRLGAYNWQADLEGDVRSGSERVNIERDLGFDDDNFTVFYAALEHPLPLLPNIAVARTDLDASARGRPGKTFDFDGTVFTPLDQVSTDLDLSHTDVTLYYELLDNVVSLDLGLTVRRFDEGVTLAAAGRRATLELDETLPMLYVAARVDLPFSGLYAGVDANAVRYSDNRLVDYRAHVGYITSFGLGLELGLRSFDLSYDDSDDEADITIEGAYGSLLFRF